MYTTLLFSQKQMSIYIGSKLRSTCKVNIQVNQSNSNKEPNLPNHVNKQMQWINVHTSSNLIKSKVKYMHKSTQPETTATGKKKKGKLHKIK